MRLETIIRLSLINSIGFLVSTLVAIWLGSVAAHFDMPAWFAGFASFALIGGAALLNTLTPQLFGRYAPRPLGRVALCVAGAGYFVALLPHPAFFALGCVIAGCATGVVLNIVNRIMGSSDHVQSSYAILVLVQIGFGAVSYLASATLASNFGVLACFAYSGTAALLGSLLLGGAGFEDRREDQQEAPAAVGQSLATPPNGTAGFLALASMALFYIGLAPLSAFMPAIGEATGLSTERANQIIGLGLPFSLVGAIVSKLLGERVRPLAAVTSCAVLLAASGPLITMHPSFALFIGGVFITVAPAMFATPYFFAQLGALDPTGRYAAKGPAMMLSGLAIGPSIAVMLNGRYGLASIGLFSSALLLLSAVAFTTSIMVRSPAKP
jgi:hypothetical protein